MNSDRDHHLKGLDADEDPLTFRRLVGQVLARVLHGGPWTLSVTPDEWRGAGGGCAGGVDGTSWYQWANTAPVPASFVVEGMVYIVNYLAIPSLEWKGSLLRLERIMSGRKWARIPIDLVVERDPGILPAIWAMNEFRSLPWHQGHARPIESADDYRYYEVLRDHPRDDTVWQIGMSKPGLIVKGRGQTVEFAFPEVLTCPFDLPQLGEFIDAHEIWAQEKTTAPKRGLLKPTGYQVRIEESESDDDQDSWTLADEQLGAALGVANCVEAEAQVMRAVKSRDKGLLKSIEFDSDGGCFYAHAKTPAAAGRLAQLIADLVADTALS